MIPDGAGLICLTTGALKDPLVRNILPVSEEELSPEVWDGIGNHSLCPNLKTAKCFLLSSMGFT